MKKCCIMGVAVLILTACSSVIKMSSNDYENVEIPKWIMQNVRIYNLPVHYTEEILCGHDCVVYFKYGMSSAIFFSAKAAESPNMEIIEKTKTVPAVWRRGEWFYREYKEWVYSIDNDSVRSELLLTYNDYCQCTTKDIFDGEPDPSKPLDLRGTDDKNCCWRDVKVNDFCIGYYGVPPSGLAEFDRCIDVTLIELAKQ